MNDKKLIAALKKKAVGFSADEIVEEYIAGEEGELKLTKRKVTKKYYPPDTAAIKNIAELEDDLSELTDAELEAEKQRLIKLLKENHTVSAVSVPTQNKKRSK